MYKHLLEQLRTVWDYLPLSWASEIGLTPPKWQRIARPCHNPEYLYRFPNCFLRIVVEKYYFRTSEILVFNKCAPVFS